MPNVALRVKRPSARKAVSSPAKSGSSSSPVKVSPVKSPAWPVKPSASPVKAGSSSSHSPARASTSRNSVSGTPKSSSRHTPNVPKHTPTVVLRNTPTISTPKSILKRSPKKDLKRLNPDGSAVKPKKVVLIEPEKKSKPKAKPKKPAQEETSYVVEAVVSKKKENGETFYKIRWAGYGSKDDSWVSEKNCSCHWAIKKFEEEKKKGKDSKESKKPAANQEPEKAKKRTQTKGNTFPNSKWLGNIELIVFKSYSSVLTILKIFLTEPHPVR
ncbi:inactive protein tyrosine kinase pTKL-like [Paramacrobiotus metropolitanus]|uniref:inactive protein tyrosine kinase pTKL-like n=1 Tax=Paramacrobiotus metropolitanus TaxID=2943436 RepID=UPI0024463E7C|nr:inactive protein tyrosine kinase pTKL-like [Paramacrobiotus metropolitanus]